MKILFFAFFSLLSISSFGAIIKDTLYLNRDTLIMGGYNVNRCAFNNTPTFAKNNAILDVEVGDILELTIYNLDTVPHDITNSNGLLLGSLAIGGDDTYTITYTSFGTYGVYASDPIGDLLGAFCIVRVGLMNEMAFVWNLWEMEYTLSHEIGSGYVTTIPVDYRPDVYTINALDYPMTTSDPIGSVMGNVGDTIYISVVNSGSMIHTLHFHGFHFKVKQISRSPKYLNWEKDSLPFVPHEAATLMLVPDKEGMYPVHDHNLISVLTQGGYPGGMITSLHIQP